MSFLTDLFEGKTSNLLSDISPSNIFSDIGTDTSKVLSNPLADIGIAASIALPFVAPEIGAALGIGGAAAGAGSAAADVGFDLGTIGPGVASATDASTALSFAAPAATAGADTSGLTAIDTALAGGGPSATTVGSMSPSDVAALTAGAPGTTTAPATPSFFSSLVSGAETSITKNPLGIALAGGGLAYDVLAGRKTDPNQQQLQAIAPQLLTQGTTLTASGQQLQTYLTSGTLPPALQAQVTQSVAAAKANIVANAAANGQNTNPTQNSQLAADLAAADQNGLVLAGQLEQQLFSAGTQLLQTGVNETGLSSQIYETLVKMDTANNQEIMTAIASMAAALGGGTKIQIGGTGTTLTA